MSELGDFLKAVAEAKADYEQNDPKGRQQKEIKDTIKTEAKVGLGDLFRELASLKQQVEDIEAGVVTESKIEPIKPLVETTPIVISNTTQPVKEDMGTGDKDIQQYVKSDAFKQHKAVWEPPGKENLELKGVKDQIKFLEQWISRISSTGPGGGAGSILQLDMPTKQVTGDYTVTRYDYYVGVNADVKTYITLPTDINNGREVIIKDESGHAQLTPIKIIGTIDNDPNGAEIRINNGSITLLYRNGWRIV